MGRTQEQIDALLDRVESLLGEYDKADDTFKRGQWHDHFAEKLDPYCDKLKALNGDDFDLYKESYDEYSKDFSDLDADEYVTKLVENIDALLDKLRGALGEDKVELESGPEGTEVVSHEDTDIKANVADEPKEDEMTSDDRAKKMAGWKNPSKSGGRDGHTGIPGSYTKKITSDEESKEKPEETAEEVKDAVENPAAKVVEEVVVKPLTEEPGEEPKEVDELEEFIKDLEKYPKAK